MEKDNDTYKETKSAYDRIAGRYLKSTLRSHPSELAEFISLLPKGSMILEVGVAGGRDAKAFVDEGMEVVGTDIVEGFLEQARAFVPQAKFLNKDMRELDFNDEEFDAIWANAVLLHAKWSDISRIIRNFYRMLKIGGKVHIRVKEGRGEGYKAERLSEGVKRFFTYFTQEEVEKILQDEGFKIIRSTILDDEHGREDTKWISVWGEKLK